MGDGNSAIRIPDVGDVRRHPSPLPAWLISVFAVACGVTIGNIYYAQPLIALIAQELGIRASFAGAIVALTQVGFGAGLVLIVPLSDRFENRRLILLAMSLVVVGLVGITLSRSAATFLVASFVVGLSAVATQILITFVSQLVPDESRGKVIGTVLGGLLTGIMLARPFATYVAGELGWRAVFAISAALMVTTIVVLWHVLPRRMPTAQLGYAAIMHSLPGIVLRTPVLRRRAFYQGMLFAGFNIFWTGTPLLLAREFGMDHRGIALFTLAGAAGALSAPIAGRLADAGRTRITTGFAIAAVVGAFALSDVAARSRSIALLVIAALVLDAAVQMNQVLSLRALYTLAPELRGRLQGLYMAAIFLCGAVGSTLGVAAYESGRWGVPAAAGAILGAMALLLYAGEYRRDAHRHYT